MFERFTVSARRTLFFGRVAASDLGSAEIRPEHLLLGLIEDNHPVTREALARLRVSPSSLRQELRSKVSFGRVVPISEEIPIASPARRVLQYAAEEADRLGHKHIGPEHLLFGLVAEEGSVAARALRQRRLTLDKARQLAAELATPETIPQEEQAELGSWSIAADDAARPPRETAIGRSPGVPRWLRWSLVVFGLTVGTVLIGSAIAVLRSSDGAR